MSGQRCIDACKGACTPNAAPRSYQHKLAQPRCNSLAFERAICGASMNTIITSSVASILDVSNRLTFPQGNERKRSLHRTRRISPSARSVELPLMCRLINESNANERSIRWGISLCLWCTRTLRHVSTTEPARTLLTKQHDRSISRRLHTRLRREKPYRLTVARDTTTR